MKYKKKKKTKTKNKFRSQQYGRECRKVIEEIDGVVGVSRGVKVWMAERRGADTVLVGQEGGGGKGAAGDWMLLVIMRCRVVVFLKQ